MDFFGGQIPLSGIVDNDGLLDPKGGVISFKFFRLFDGVVVDGADETDLHRNGSRSMSLQFFDFELVDLLSGYIVDVDATKYGFDVLGVFILGVFCIGTHRKLHVVKIIFRYLMKFNCLWLIGKLWIFS